MLTGCRWAFPGGGLFVSSQGIEKSAVTGDGNPVCVFGVGREGLLLAWKSHSRVEISFYANQNPSHSQQAGAATRPPKNFFLYANQTLFSVPLLKQKSPAEAGP